MKIGFMPDNEQDFLSEVEFAKNNFDFIELTSEENLDKYNKKYIQEMRNVLRGIEIIGHIHWRIDILSKSGLKIAESIIEIMKDFGAEKIVIHPYNRNKINVEELQMENKNALLKINNFCNKTGMKLMVENKNKDPFNSSKSFSNIFPELSIALDIGHAKRTSADEIDNFLKLKNKIKHVHLHDAKGNLDHISFENKEELKFIVNKIKKVNPEATITLEIFRKIKDGKLISLENNERREILLEQLKLIRKLTK